MSIPIEQSLSERILREDMKELAFFFNREMLPTLRKAREIINELAWEYTENTDDFAWHLTTQCHLFINHTSGATPEITVDSAIDLESLRPARIFTLVLYNGTGVSVTPSFSSDFNATTAAIAAGSRASWRFMVRHPEFTAVSAILLEI